MRLKAYGKASRAYGVCLLLPLAPLSLWLYLAPSSNDVYTSIAKPFVYVLWLTFNSLCVCKKDFSYASVREWCSLFCLFFFFFSTFSPCPSVSIFLCVYTLSHSVVYASSHVEFNCHPSLHHPLYLRVYQQIFNIS